MKRIVLLLLTLVFLLSLLSLEVYSAMTYDSTFYRRNLGYVNSGNVASDPIYLFMAEIETDVEGWTIDGLTTLTFPTNGLTIDNANNNALEINENSDELILTFGSDTVTMSSGDLTSFSFGTIPVDLDQFISNSVTYTLPTADGGSGQQLTTNSSGVLSWAAAGTASAGGSDTQIQYNNGGTTLGGITSFIWDDTNVEIADDVNLALGTDADGLVQYDTAAGQVLLMMNANGASAATDPMFQILVDADTDNGGNVTADQDAFSVSKGKQATNIDLFVVDEDGDVTIAGDEAVTGSTTITTNLTVNGNVDLGNALTDTLTVTAKIDGDVYFDDDSGATPSVIFRDGTEETAIFSKADSGYLSMTTPAADGMSILTGNLKVGSGTPGVSLNGEDAYVYGTFEVDGSAQFDGAVSNTSTTTLGGDVALNDQLAATFASNDEEILVTNTATTITADNLVEVVMAAQTTNTYILALTQTPNADADNDYLICADTTGTGTMLTVADGGETTWTLDPAADVIIGGVDHTAATGLVDIDMDGYADGSEAVNIKVTYDTGGGGAETMSGIAIDLDDDSGAATVLYGIRIDPTDTDGSATIVGLDLANDLDDGIVATVGAGTQAIVVDAATTDHTGTAGVIDIEFDSKTAGAEAVNIKATHLTGGSGQEVAAMEIELDADSGNSSDLLVGLIINASETTATGKVDGIQVTGTGIQRAFQSEFGYVQIGTGGSPGISPGNDDLYVEGTIEADGAVQFDSTAALNGTTTWTLPAASYVKIDGDATASTTTGGIIDLDAKSATANNSAINIDYELDNGGSGTQHGIFINLKDDAAGGDETFNAIYIDNSFGANATTRGVFFEDGLNDCLVADINAASQFAVVDAETITNTSTAGIWDIAAILSSSGGTVIDIDVESEADTSTEEVYGIHIEMDDDADQIDNEIHGLHVAGDGTNGTGLQHAIVTSGANIDAGLWCETGYLRVGTGGSPGLSLGAADNAYIEGTLEVDGNVQFDGTTSTDTLASVGSGARQAWSTNSKTQKRIIMPMCLGSAATEMRIGTPGFPALCVGLAGVDWIGSTLGYIDLSDGADFVRFGLQLPDDFIDAGGAGDLVLEFDIHEQAGEECNLEVSIFDYNDTSADISVDTLTIADGAPRGWVGLGTLSSGIGGHAIVSPEAVLLVEITQEGGDNAEDCYIYGARLTYTTGIENTQ